MTYEKATLSKLYYNDTDAYDPMCIGVFAGENVGCLAQNIMLAATELDLGTCFLGSVQMMFAEPAMKERLQSLGFSEGYHLRYALAVGYPDETPEAKERDMSKIKFVE